MDAFRVSPVSTCFFLNVQTRKLRAHPLSQGGRSDQNVGGVGTPEEMERSFREHGYTGGEGGAVRIGIFFSVSGGENTGTTVLVAACVSPLSPAVRVRLARCLQT